jgi:hypothetical protein
LRLLDNVSIQDMLQDSENEPAAGLANPLIALQRTNSSELHGLLRK